MVQITKHIWRIPVAKADVYSTEVWLLYCEGGLILVDVGFTDFCFENIEVELKKMSKSWEDIRMVIITHAHFDQIMNLKRVTEVAKMAEVMVGEGDFDELRNQTGVQPTMGLDNGDIIDACGGIEVISIPGHSPGNLCLYLKEEKTLIAGDTIMMNKFGNLMPPLIEYNENSIQAKENIKILMDYDFDKLLLSHGEPVVTNAKGKVTELLINLKIL